VKLEAHCIRTFEIKRGTGRFKNVTGGSLTMTEILHPLLANALNNMPTFFESISRSFAQVKTTPGIDTKEFLEATEGLIKMFDLLGSASFSVVQSDMNGNVKKIRDRYVTNETANSTLQSLVINEKDEKKRTATEGLLWLNRGLSFTSKALRSSLSNSSEELSVSFSNSYEGTLKQFHGVFVRPIFALAMKACPYRSVFLREARRRHSRSKGSNGGMAVCPREKCQDSRRLL